MFEPMAYQRARFELEPLESFLGRRLTVDEAIDNLTEDELVELLTTSDKRLRRAILGLANRITLKQTGGKVAIRALMEFSNVCVKNCVYCGLRRSNRQIDRYTLDSDVMVESALAAFQRGYATIMLQSGELPTSARIKWLEETILRLRTESIWEELRMRTEYGHTMPLDFLELLNHDIVSKELAAQRHLGMGVALSLGNLSRSWLQRLFDAGAHRYLIRIETSNQELYRSMHPVLSSFDERLKTIDDLHDIGFQVGSGVLVGIPNQTTLDLARDVVFLRDRVQCEMVGMGPYIPAENTPMWDTWWEVHPECRDKASLKAFREELAETVMRMNALVRISLGEVNIASTTAFRLISPSEGLSSGCNVLMQNITPHDKRSSYALYDRREFFADAPKNDTALTQRVRATGHNIAWGEWTEPPKRRRPTTTTTSTTSPLSTILPSQRPQSSGVRHVARGFATAAHDTVRLNLGIFGGTNAGKSTLMNLITQGETSLVDPTPGTTADTKVALVELHGLGPVRLLDTAGVNEDGGTHST